MTYTYDSRKQLAIALCERNLKYDLSIYALTMNATTCLAMVPRPLSIPKEDCLLFGNSGLDPGFQECFWPILDAFDRTQPIDTFGDTLAFQVGLYFLDQGFYSL